MAKGSQLVQLKSALRQAGITRTPENGTKRKRTGSREADRDKKAVKLSEIDRKLNPFDVKVTKLKHDVGGRRLKGVTGRPAQKKQAGIEQRKETLLKEFEERGRAGGILDRRFGENDPTMTPEERMLERFTKERQRASRGVVFNLEDGDELTHYGQSLSKLDDFDDTGLGLDDEDEESGQLDREIVQKTHFGGFDEEDDEEGAEGEPPRKKSKAEVMAEVMAKSKEHKLQRQIEREREDAVRQQLDSEFDSLRALLYAPEPASKSQQEVAPLPTPSKDPPPAEASAIPSSSVNQSALDAFTSDEAYDRAVRQLAFDARAHAKDRTKTEEELALEKKEELERAERRRLRRMRGEDEESDEEDHGRRGKRTKRARGGDDLEDDFQDDEWGIGAGLEDDVGGLSESHLDGMLEEGSSEDEDESGSGEEDDEDGFSGSEEDASGKDASDPENLVSSKVKSADTSNRRSQLSKKELPFTFPCPASHDEFLEIVEDVDEEDVPTVVQRVRALYHPSLAQDNKVKLQGLAGVLVDYILHISAPPTPQFSLLATLVPHLSALTTAYPTASANHFISKLTLMHKNLARGLARGPLDPSAKTWPGTSELAFLRLVGILWPTSDMNHAVATPARLLMGSYLGLARVRTLSDIASGLFLCTLFLQFESRSKRLIPEALNFLINTVLHLAPTRIKDTASLPGSFPAPDFGRTGLVLEGKEARTLAVNKLVLTDLLCRSEIGVQDKVDVLGLALDLLGRLADMYKGLDGFPELFRPVLEVIATVKTKRLPDELQTRVASLTQSLTKLLKFAEQARKPLLLQAHKPIPIPSYIPKFETTSSSYLRRQDPDHERAEASKLRRQHKQERKGAIRELRKDARFLAGVEQQKQAEKDAAYASSMKRALGSIEGERAEEKTMLREKKREKKRAGRK